MILLKPKEMCKVIIAGPKSIRGEVVKTLHKQGVLHIDDYIPVSGEEQHVDIGSAEPEAALLSETLLKARAIRAQLKITGKAHATRQNKPAIKDLPKEVKRIDSEVAQLFDEIKELDERVSEIKAKEDLLGPLAALGIDTGIFTEYRAIAYSVGHLPKSADIHKITEGVKKITQKSQVFSAEHNGKYVFAVFSEAGKKEQVMAYISKSGFSELPTQAISGIEGKPKDALKKMSKDKHELLKRREKLKEEIDELGKKYASFIVETEKKIADELDISEAPLRFAETRNAFVVEGWVPSDKYRRLESELEKSTGEKIYLRKSDTKKGAPTALQNPKPVKPFEFFMDLYSLPKYTEVDPTAFMFLTFPFFFGFMLGDIGYGLLTLGLFLFLRKKTGSAELRAVLNVMVFSSIMTIIFGYVYGEFFGAEHIFGYELHPILNRLHAAEELLAVSVAVGVLHINIGLAVGFYNELKAHGFKAALFEKASWMLLQAGAAVYALAGELPGIAVMLLSVAMIGLGEGVKGVLELPSILANILSYSRLMAVGLASAILALVVNEMAAGAFQAGIPGMIIGLIILAAGHGINIALGLMSPFIHSMRLHYVEFFLKFYHGGGKKYTPFGGKGQ